MKSQKTLSKTAKKPTKKARISKKPATAKTSTIRVSFYASKNIHTKIKNQATKEQLSLSDLLNKAILKYLEL